MENKEEKKDGAVVLDRQIQVVVNNADTEGTEINLGRVLHRMKLKTRVFAWLLLLCMAAGVCAPVLLYQVSKAPLTVSSVVTLNYKVKDEPVQTLTAPDEEDLDLAQISSAYVLQNALNGMKLSGDLNVKNLRDNLKIERILTEDSRRQQEITESMIEVKNAAAYNQVMEMELEYSNQFVVSLTNGFGEEDSRTKTELEDWELRELLDRILNAYNDYLVKSYSELKLPDDEVSVIDTENLDIQEALDLLRTAEDHLYAYCEEMPEDVQAYRSWRNGRSLTDWMEILETAREVNIDYLYAFVYANGIVKDKTSMITNYQFQLRNTQTQLDGINENIATVDTILASYKNDEIFISMQESDATRSTRTTTDYYNTLVLQQAENYQKVATLYTTITDLKEKLDSLQEGLGNISTIQAQEELGEVLKVSKAVYEGIYEHMEEIIDSSTFSTYAMHSTAHGKEKSFLTANMTKMIIFAVVGAIIACGFWFLSALAPELHHDEEEKRKNGKEVRA